MNAKFLRNGIVMLVLVAGTVALLLHVGELVHARGQPMGYSKFLADVKAGKVTKVVQDGETLTVTVTPGAPTVHGHRAELDHR